MRNQTKISKHSGHNHYKKSVLYGLSILILCLLFSTSRTLAGEYILTFDGVAGPAIEVTL